MQTPVRKEVAKSGQRLRRAGQVRVLRGVAPAW